MASSVLAPVQERGRAALEQLGLPNRRQEPWRLTDLKRLAAVSELPVSVSPLSTSLPASLDGVTRLMLNGFDDPLAGQVLPEGITALNAEELEQAPRPHPGSLRLCPGLARGVQPCQSPADPGPQGAGTGWSVGAGTGGRGAGLNATRVLLLLEEKGRAGADAGAAG